MRARHGESVADYEAHIAALSAAQPQVTIDDGADLLIRAHSDGRHRRALIGGTEETTTGLIRLRRLHERGELRCPVLAVNEARTERALNDRHGTGQSALDGIIRATNVLLAGQTIVVDRIRLGRAGNRRARPRRRGRGDRLRDRPAAGAGGDGWPATR